MAEEQVGGSLTAGGGGGGGGLRGGCHGDAGGGCLGEFNTYWMEYILLFSSMQLIKFSLSISHSYIHEHGSAWLLV